MRWVGLLLAGGCVALSAAAQQTPLAGQIAAMVAEPAVARAHWGVYVTELDGTPIFGLNEGQFFQPASNAKLFTTAAAMALLPASHVFTTELRGHGRYLAGGVLQGDLTLIGVGDANLSGRDLPYVSPSARLKLPRTEKENDPVRYLAEMADQVKAAGVTKITGDIRGDDSDFHWEPYPQDWTIDDAVWGYGAPVSALTIADNQLRLTIRPGVPGEPNINTPAVVTLEQAVPYYTVDAFQTHTVPAGQPTAIAIERDIGSRRLRIHGQIAAGAPPEVEEIAIEDPAEYAAMALKKLLEDRGIMVIGAAKAHHSVDHPSLNFTVESREPIADLASVPKSKEWPVRLYSGGPMGSGPEWSDKVLASHISPQLVEDVVVTNKVSQNLHAELMLHQLGMAITGNGSTAQGVRVVRQFLVNAGIDAGDFVFYDGSGLSGHDLVTPRATAKLLSYAARDPKTGAAQSWFADWKASLPVGGVDGSLGGRFAKAPLAGHVFAKTGTLGEARALSGYLECASGKTVIFSIMDTSHMPGNADRDVMDRIVGAIAAAE